MTRARKPCPEADAWRAAAEGKPRFVPSPWPATIYGYTRDQFERAEWATCPTREATP